MIILFNKKTVEMVDVNNKKVLVRVDFNVPLDSITGEITDDLRIKSALPTIEYLLEKNAAIILISHLGRPKGKIIAEMSLKPVFKYLKKILNNPVFFVDDCIGEKVDNEISKLKSGEILLLENLRFYKEETSNDLDFAKKLSKLADLYVNDAFGTAHRAHASTEGVTHYLESVAGFLLKKEINFLVDSLENPIRPFTAIIGGKKVHDKIKVLKRLLEKTDTLLIGGGMAYTFLKAIGKEIGDSIVDIEGIDVANEILQVAKREGKELVLPFDVVVADKFGNDANIKVVDIDNIPNGWQGLDIGPETVKIFSEIINNSKTCIWNGPLGVFEFENFARGSKSIAEVISKSDCISIIGGGDTAAAIRKFDLARGMSHISTGGGASLELLEGKILPGLSALDDKDD